jgi:hypothetical protein
MVKSTAKTVDDYIAEASPDRAQAQTQLRALIKTTLRHHEESM